MSPKENKKQTSFLRSLANYSALGGALIGSLNQAQATIQYATLPGTPVTTGNQAITVPTGTLTASISFGAIVRASGAGGVELYRQGIWVHAVDLNFSITSGLNWLAGQDSLGYSTQGPFPGQSNKYMAFRFNNGGTMNYGWVRVDVSAISNSFTLYDYAYQDDGTAILAGDTGPLPITLLSFEAKMLPQEVQLVWSTAQEQNFDGFALERAEEGSAFSEIAWLPGKGSSTELQDYRYNDKAIFENKRYYYRLKAIDLDGSYEYSQIVEVAFSTLGYSVGDPYPNPTIGNSFSLDITALETESVGVKIFTTTGQMLDEQRIQLTPGTNTISLNIPHLTAGIYYVKVQGRYHSKYKQLIVR